VQRFLDTYWILYFAGYVVAIFVLGWLYSDDLGDGANRIFLLAAIFGVAAGAASAVAIIVEVGGRLVLLIPAAVRKILEQGREQGREEGREKGRQEERAEWEAWLERRKEAEASNVPFNEPPPSQQP
jgi:hypothetical protein